MALTRRGKAAIGGGTAAAVIVGGALVFAGKAPAPIQRALDTVTGRTPPPTCPLTGGPTADGEAAPARPLLAVKVENTKLAYPLSGLDAADMVYEEVVEGGITRFVALFHCADADRIGPVRSARTTDPRILEQFQQRPLLGYSGGAPKVVKSLVEAGIVQITEGGMPEAFERDDARQAPHNLFTSTSSLWKAGEAFVEHAGSPRGVFEFDEDVPEGAKPVSSVSIVFSDLSRTGWRWDADVWTRKLDGDAFELENGEPVTAANVVIQRVEVATDTIVDASGSHSPIVTMTGSGKAIVLRDGKAIYGTWTRPAESDLTVFRTKSGDEITLAPGVTWVELVPTDGTVKVSARR
jgi:hypothetical protein